MDENTYNRICSLFWLEEVRRQNTVTDLKNMIMKTRTTDPTVYIKLAQAEAVANYFDYFCSSFLDWVGGFVET